MLTNEPSYEYQPAESVPVSQEPLQPSAPVFELDPRVVTLQSVTEPPEVKQEAFASIVEEHGPGLQRFAAKIVGPFEAEDVVQDIFLRAWVKVDTLQPTHPRSLPKWLYKIAYNASLNKKRDRVAAQKSEYPRPLSPIGDPVATQEFYDDIASINEKLPETQKQALMLRVFGFSPEDIAEKQDTTVSSAKARLQRGRVHARNILRPKQDLKPDTDTEESETA
jgi:RNA polymerase sigma factor (sigma-70 family)